jgi:membrane-associated phospholipid phosphatase
MAALTGYLRIAADKHYFTDVLVGAIVGSAIGVAVPYFAHRPSTDAPDGPPAARGGVPAMSFGGAF